MEIKLNKSNDNPFFGLKACLRLFNSTNGSVTTSMLDNAWKEVKDDKTKRELFFSLLFSIGDITARQHNIFKGVKKDSGGNANREGFATVLSWLWTNQRKQFEKFLDAQLFNEYTCFDALLKNRVQTSKQKVVQVFNAFEDGAYRRVIVNYLYKVINGTNPFNKTLVAKFLTLPRLSQDSPLERDIRECLMRLSK